MMSAAARPQQTAVPAQDAPPQQGGFTLQVKSQLVVLDVVVTNKKGENVRHLTKDDFMVFEDKTPQTVLSFEEHLPPPGNAAPVAVDSTAELDRLEPQAPVTILVLDELTSKFEDLSFARYSLKKYLDTQGDVLSQPTMLIAANYDNIAVLRDYTTSKKEIENALEHHMANYGALMMRSKSQEMAGTAVGAALGLLDGVAQATEGHPGHKNMIWIGRGFPTIDRSQIFDEQLAILDAQLSACTSLLRTARVTLYSIDPAGLTAAAPVQDENGMENDPFGGQVDFDTMAEATGGRAMHGRNDVDAIIAETVRDGVSFYTLSYRPAAVNDATKPFRNIRVAMRDKSLQASAREGYFTAPPAVDPWRDAKGKPSQQLVADLGVAGSSWLVYDGVPLQVVRDQADPDRFLLHLAASALTVEGNEPGKANAEVTVLLESFDRRGKLLKKHAYVVALHVEHADLPVDLSESLATAPPAARIRVVVRDNKSGKVGADNVFLVDRKLISDPTGINRK
jgi:VWFA-related protein